MNTAAQFPTNALPLDPRSDDWGAFAQPLAPTMASAIASSRADILAHHHSQWAAPGCTTPTCPCAEYMLGLSDPATQLVTIDHLKQWLTVGAYLSQVRTGYGDLLRNHPLDGVVRQVVRADGDSVTLDIGELDRDATDALRSLHRESMLIWPTDPEEFHATGPATFVIGALEGHWRQYRLEFNKAPAIHYSEGR